MNVFGSGRKCDNSGIVYRRDKGFSILLCHSLTKYFHWFDLIWFDSSILHGFSHWAIMTRATERTDSEIHSFSHWAIMTRATERTDSEIHSFSHWAIMTRATERTDSEIHSFSHWAIMTDWLLCYLINRETLKRFSRICLRSIRISNFQ